MKKSFLSLSFFLMLLYLCSCNNSNNAKTQSETGGKPELKSIFINGDSLHYIDIGKGEPVVFVHAGYSDYRTWRKQMDDFSKNHRAIAYSRRYCFPNKNPIDSTSQFSMVHVNDLVSFIKSIDAGPVHLVGHSAGGWIALQAAIQHPELIKTLILGEPAVVDLYGSDSVGEMHVKTFIQGLMPVNEAYRRNQDEKAAELFFGLVNGKEDYYQNLSKEDREMIMDNVPESKAASLVQKPKGDAPPPITCGKIKELTFPVLLVCAQNSPKFVTYMQDKFEACLKNGERVTISNSSHGLHADNPVVFNKVVLDFIAKQ